ncbi:MAG TPA: hypothetical protein VFI47_01915 [Acidimicrobiales bacterium]|nr:hypothetical protein [Acidimicrobiales bacterium]
MPRRFLVAGVSLVVVLAALQVFAVVGHAGEGDASPTGAGLAAVPALLAAPAAEAARTTDAYGGLGAWVDLYDVPGPGAAPGGVAAVSPAVVDDMAAHGVRTLYLQVARDTGEGDAGLADRELTARFLVLAHRRGLRVVGWFVPRFGDVARDLDHLRAIDRFEVLGHRFDGIAVDIEWTRAVPDPAERSARLVELSQGLRDTVGADALGAIVLPPVQTEVVNPALWPGFPWGELADIYDAWLPMGYWTERTVASGYRDAATYTTENIDRLRSAVGDDAVVHAIGGLAEESTPDDIAAFADAADAGGAAGVSLYDWATLAPEARRLAGEELGG